MCDCLCTMAERAEGYMLYSNEVFHELHQINVSTSQHLRLERQIFKHNSTFHEPKMPLDCVIIHEHFQKINVCARKECPYNAYVVHEFHVKTKNLSNIA